MGRDREREPLEDGLKLDLNLLLRQGVVRKGSKRRRTIVWSQSYTGEVVATGELSSDLSGDTRGSIRMQMGDLDQLIDLIAAPRHFGGAQWYFTCPVLRCRASVLWMPPGAHCFACRKAWGSQVAYRSQFESRHDRAQRRAQDIRFQLGGEDFISIDGLQPPRPKGMHQRTYGAQIEQMEAYEMRTNSHVLALIERLKRR
jgi:hypothetical protein